MTMAKYRDEIVANAIRCWKQKDRTNENWFKSIVEGAWNSGYKRGMDDAIEVEKAKHLWIPITERLPEESGHYLIYVIGGEFKQWSMVTMAYYHKRFYYDDMEDNFDQVTHWMPLPEPPKDGAE